MIKVVRNNTSITGLNKFKYVLYTEVGGRPLYAKIGIKPIFGYILFKFKHVRV